MNSLLKFTTIFFVVAIFAVSAGQAHAQLQTSIDGVTISADPANPSPGQNVTVTVTSYNTDLNSASIVWIVGNKSLAKGTGLTSVDVTAPDIGKSLLIEAVIVTIEGRQIQKILTLTSGDIDLIWQSEGYVPPFFKGKSLFAYQNEVKFIAIPHLAADNGVEIDPRTLVYKWKQGDTVLQDQSGFGKQSVIVQQNLPESTTIEVEVNSRDGKETADDTMTLNPIAPSVTLYQNDPLYGVLYNKALVGKVPLLNQEMSIIAAPYYFSDFTAQLPLQYTWTIDGQEQDDLSKNQDITLRTNGTDSGTSDISVEIQNINGILQQASDDISVLFGPSQTSQPATTF